MVLDGQRMGDERDWVLVGFFVTCSSSAEKRFIRPAKQDEMGLCLSCILQLARSIDGKRRISTGHRPPPLSAPATQLLTTIMSDADSTATPVASNSSVKGVTFAPSPPRSSNGGGGKNLIDASKDATMSIDELLMALKEVRSELSQAKWIYLGRRPSARGRKRI